jgi:hypothetical protein
MAIRDYGYDSGAAKSYTDWDSAYAACNVGDTLRVWQSNTAGSYTHQLNKTISKGIIVEGAYPGRKVRISGLTTYALRISGGAVTIRNLRLTGNSSGSMYVLLMASSEPCTVEDCDIRSGRDCIYVQGAAAPQTIRNCFVDALTTLIFVTGCTETVSILACTLIASIRGDGGVYSGQGASYPPRVIDTTVLNVFSSGCFYGIWHADSDYNISSDATAPGAHSLINQTDIAIGVIGTVTAPGAFDPRPTPSSVIATGGVDVGLTSDWDGKPYPSGVFPRGCSIGYTVPEQDKVLTTAIPAGNYVPPSVADVRPVTFGVSQTGTLANLNGTESAYQDLEESRNLGVPADKLLVGNSIVIAGIETAGSFDEAARNSGAAANKIRTGSAIVQKGVTYTGAVAVPSPSDVRKDVPVDDTVGTLDVGSLPDQPTLSVVDLGSGSVRLTISESTAGSVTRIYVRGATSSAWPTTPTATISGDGSADVSLGAGPYLAKGQSEFNTLVSPLSNEPVLFHLLDAASGYDRSDFGTEFREEVMPEMLDAFGESVTYRRGVQAVSLTAIQGDVMTANDTATGIDVAVGDGSWEIVADQLDFGSGPIVPKAHDQIITAKGEVYSVVEAGALDSEQMAWTIPVKRSEYRELP